MKQITANELVWGLGIAPALAGCLSHMWNVAWEHGLLSRDFRWDKSWTPVFQARPELLEMTMAIYMLGKLYRLLGAEVRVVVLMPGEKDTTLNSPPFTVPFTRE